jgi:hypothetical protein
MSEPLGDDYARVHEIILDARGSERLTDWESDFIDDLYERVHRYGDATLVSEKQMAIVDRIERKLYG